MSISDSSKFEEDWDSIIEKASTLKQLVLQPEWNRTDVKESLEGLKRAHSALKTKMQQERDEQQPDDLKQGNVGNVESMPSK